MSDDKLSRQNAIVVWAGLIAAVLLFGGVVTFLEINGLVRSQLAVPQPVLVGFVAVIVGALLAGWLLPSRVSTGEPGDPRAMSRLIMGLGLCEGGAMLSLVGLLLSHERLFAVPYAVCLTAMLAQFPSRERWERLRDEPGPGPTAAS